MKFYIVNSSEGEAVAACMTLKDAIGDGILQCGTDFSITAVDVPVTAETIRRLLGNHGGYATRTVNYTDAGKRVREVAA